MYDEPKAIEKNEKKTITKGGISKAISEQEGIISVLQETTSALERTLNKAVVKMPSREVTSTEKCEVSPGSDIRQNIDQNNTKIHRIHKKLEEILQTLDI